MRGVMSTSERASELLSIVAVVLTAIVVLL